MSFHSHATLTLTRGQPDLIINARVRQLHVRLPYNASTGYSWFFLYKPATDTGLQVVHRGVDTSGCGGVVGCNTVALFDVNICRPLQSGQVLTLAFVSLRAFDVAGSFAGAEPVVFKVRVA